jgi:hypothetical protein
MTKKELVELLKPFPDEVIIYVESDHGQTPEQAGSISLSKDEQLPHNDFDGDMGWKDEGKVENVDHVTAIKIW